MKTGAIQKWVPELRVLQTLQHLLWCECEAECSQQISGVHTTAAANKACMSCVDHTSGSILPITGPECVLQHIDGLSAQRSVSILCGLHEEPFYNKILKTETGSVLQGASETRGAFSGPNAW